MKLYKIIEDFVVS